MIPRAMDSLELVEMVMLSEQIFGAEIPDNDAGDFGGPREIVDWLEPRLSNLRPNKQATALLRKLAEDQQRPELGEGLHGTGRREQIASIVPEVFR
ncbi:MAG: hypothetical protein WA628_12310 [Terriglobales bacterium]